MIELHKEEYKKVTPLLQKIKGIHMSANAVVEYNQPGHIFVNNQTNPSSCLIVNSGGTYLVLGEEGDADFNSSLLDFLKDKSNHLNYYDLNLSSEKWLDLMKKHLEGDVVELSRTEYVFNPEHFKQISNWASKIPADYNLKCMDEELYNKYVQYINPTYRKSWGTYQEFSSKGFGFCLLDNDKLVSTCTTDYVSGGYASIDIETAYEYRRQGNAMITCSAFIEHCIKNNLAPRWNADSGNEPSNRLATKLGFTKTDNYNMLWWHENRDVIKNYLKKYNYIN